MVEIVEHEGRFEVSGIDRRDLEEALDLLPVVQQLQADRSRSGRDDLVRALMQHRVPLVPPATLEQAHRLAAHRDSLLATEVFTHATLQELRGDRSVSATRTWLTRKRQARQLFTVSGRDGQTVVPAFQLEPGGAPRAELQPVIATALDAGVDGWQLWTWLTSRTALLSGQVPHEVARTQQERVLRAVTRFCAVPAA